MHIFNIFIACEQSCVTGVRPIQDTKREMVITDVVRQIAEPIKFKVDPGPSPGRRRSKWIAGGPKASLSQA